MVSGQTTLYQKLSVPPVDGAVNVCEIELSPLVGVVAPTRAAYVPVWPPLTADALPAAVQPESEPVSNPPLAMPPGGGGAVTVSATIVECVAEAPVPVTVSV